MRIIDLAFKDLSQIFRDWKETLLFLVVLPVGFTLMFGFVFKDAGDEGQDPRLPVAVLTQESDPFSQYLLDDLRKSDVLNVFTSEYSLQDLKTEVADGNLAAGIVIPEGFRQQIVDGDTAPEIQLIVSQTTDSGMAAYREITSYVNRLQHAVETARFVTEKASAQKEFADAAARGVYFTDVLQKELASWENPAVTLTETATGAEVNSKEDLVYGDNSYAHSSAGMMVQFALAGLIGAAEVLVAERRSGALKRLLTTTISRVGILFGHYLAMFLMIALQLFVLILFGQWVLKVPYFSAPLATFLVAVSTALLSASIGLLVATLSKTEEHVPIFALIPMFIFSGLGGAWFPLEFTSKTVQTIGHLTPVAWSMDGLKNIIVRGMGLESVILPVAVLLGYSLLFFILGAWRFRLE